MPEEWLKTMSRPVGPARIDVSAPSMARVWNYMVGGRDNFEADRLAARRLRATAPLLPRMEQAGREFYRRATAYLAGEAGIRQFIDISLGMPTVGVTHETAQAVAPDCRIVYSVSDPVALSHARALLSSSAEGVTSYVDADASDIEAILAGAGETLCLTEPVAVLMIDILNFIEDASGLVSRLVPALPAGSYVAVMQVVQDDRLTAAARQWSSIVPLPVFLRDRGQVGAWFAGLELIDPGIVEVNEWRPGPDDRAVPGGLPLLGAVARKP